MTTALSVPHNRLNGYTAQSYHSDFLPAPNNDEDRFRLDETFLSKYRGRQPKFGYNGLGEFVFYRTYSRIKANGQKESFLDVLTRVVEGCYEIQRRYCRRIHVPWDYDKALESAHEMFERMWQFKFLPPGRGLWCMGTQFMWERGSAALNNCGFVSTKDMKIDPAEPFCFLMDMSMLGVGVGFDTRGADTVKINKPHVGEITVHVVLDSREGWVEAVRLLIDSFTIKPELGFIRFDFSQIRKAGLPIKGFGGVASGPVVLQTLLVNLAELLNKYTGRMLDSVGIVDIMNIIGAAVVAGNVRRTAEIAFGDMDDLNYIKMKDYRIYPEECDRYRWASNNSLFAYVGADYTEAGKQAGLNGEPGFAWLDNMRNYGRLIDGPKPGCDDQVMGTNPCGEQSLESYELCNLVETFPANHENAQDYLRTLKFAYLYAKSVTLLPTHNQRTNSVTLRNRRIGLSQSGIIQAFHKFGRRNVLQQFCDAGYDEVCKWDRIYSRWLCIQESIKKTSVKPSGTISLVVGAWPGIHHQEDLSYWRTVRVAATSPLIGILVDAGYDVELSVTDPHTMVVKFGVVEDQTMRSIKEVTVWEQVTNVVDYQRYWADNQPSCTIKVKPSEVADIPRLLESFEDQLKCISFLPLADHGYKQAPYQPAPREEVQAYIDRLKPIDFSRWINEEAVGSKGCDGETCTIDLSPKNGNGNGTDNPNGIVGKYLTDYADQGSQ